MTNLLRNAAQAIAGVEDDRIAIVSKALVDPILIHVDDSERILIIDDDKAFLDTYEDLLSAEGYRVERATSRKEALERLDEPGWSVVLVDQKLNSPGGKDDGLELIAEVGFRAPGAKAILATAYASKEAVERAFKDGAYDYLEKGSVFQALLRVKVRNTMEAVRERWLGSLDLPETEKEIRSTWDAARSETDRNRKGLLLEQLMELLLKTIPGFNRLRTRMKNELEELDILVQNNSPWRWVALPTRFDRSFVRGRGRISSSCSSGRETWRISSNARIEAPH